MTYLRHHNSRAQQARKTAFVALFSVALIAAAIQWLSPSFFPGLLLSIAHPFWQTEFSVSSGALRSPAQLLAENESLKRQLADIRAATASSSVGLIIEENAELLDQMGRASSTPKLLAAVLAKPPYAPYDELVLDVGKDKGVGSTTLVYGPGDTLIGRVSEAYSHTARALLFTSPGQSYAVLIGSAHISADAVGQGGGQYRAEVPHGAAVHIGDAVSDPSLKDGAFGTVVSVSTDPSNPFDIVFIIPAVNPYQLRWVYLDARL